MAQSIDDKFVQQTLEALSNNQLNIGIVALRLSQLPAREQHRFFKLAVNYMQVLEVHHDRGFTRAGLEPIVKACKDLMGVVDEHFPKPDMDEVLHGLEFVQL